MPQTIGVLNFVSAESGRNFNQDDLTWRKTWPIGWVLLSTMLDCTARASKARSSERQSCARCGGHLMTNHPGLGLVDVFAATIPTLPFAPGVHINYAETVLPMRDGLPKLKDFPAAFGGSGEQISE